MGNCGAGEACFRSKCQISNLILKASLTYFMQYFDSILAYTGSVAGIQRKKGNDQDLTKYLINDGGSFWTMHVCVLVYGLQTVLSLAQKKWAQGSLCICRDGSVSTISEFIDY